jgi:ketosteroid isomerase-like protein
VSRRALLVAGGVGVVAVGGGAFFLLGGDVPDDVRAVIEENAQALEAGDVDRYMETMHPESPIYDRTRSQTEALLQQVSAGELTVEVTIESADVSGDRADVEVVQTTRADISGFRDNRAHQTHELRTYQGEWRIYNSAVEDVEYL